MREHTVKMWGDSAKMRGKCGEDVRGLFAALIVAVWGLSSPAMASTLVTGQVCAVDGDSLIFGGEMVGGRCRGGDVEVRILGIDAPEWDQTCGHAGLEWPCGRAASDAVRAMIRGKTVACLPEGRDRYKRTLAVCRVDGIDIGRKLVVDGLAVSFSGRYKAEETDARKDRRGVWSGPFMRPDKWREK